MSHSLPASRMRVPEVVGARRREVQLVRQLADEAEAHREAGHAGDGDLPVPEVREALLVERVVGQLLQQLAGVRPGHVERAERRGLVDDVDVEAPGLAPSRASTTRAARRPTW